MFKKVGIIALACSILVSGAAFAEKKVVTEETEWTYTFQEEKEYLKEFEVNAADLAVLEKMFNEVTALEKNGKSEAATEKWEAYIAHLEKVAPKAFETKEFTFDDEKEWLKDLGLTDAELVDLEKLYKEATALEKDQKFDAATLKWDAYSEILEKYFDDDNIIICSLGEIDWDDEKNFLVDEKVNATDLAKLKTLFEAAKVDEKKWDAYYAELEKIMPDMFKIESMTFSNEKEWLSELKVNDADLTKLEKLFTEAVKLEENDQYEEAEKLWDDYYKILGNYDAFKTSFENEIITFDDEKNWLKALNVDAGDLLVLEKLFADAIILEESDKYQEADKIWHDYDKISDKYYDSEKAYEMNEFTFEDEKTFLSELKVDEATMIKLEAMFKEAIELEKLEKYEEADSKWEAYYSIISKLDKK